MTRKPLSPEAKTEFNAVLRRTTEYLEQRKREKDAKALEAINGVLKELDEQPREA